MVGGARVWVQKYQGRNAPFVRLVVKDQNGKQVSVLLSWAEAMRLVRDIADLMTSETILVQRRDDNAGFKKYGKPSGWKRRKPKDIGQIRKRQDKPDSKDEFEEVEEL